MIRPTPNSIAGQHGIKFYTLEKEGEIVGCMWLACDPNGKGEVASQNCTFSKEGVSTVMKKSDFETVKKLFRSGATFSWIKQRNLTEHEFFNFNVK